MKLGLICSIGSNHGWFECNFNYYAGKPYTAHQPLTTCLMRQLWVLK